MIQSLTLSPQDKKSRSGEFVVVFSAPRPFKRMMKMEDQDLKTIHDALSEFPKTKEKLKSTKKLKPIVTKSNLKSEKEIRQRRLELFDILSEAEGNVPYRECIEGILLEYKWILCEETEKAKVREV